MNTVQALRAATDMRRAVATGQLAAYQQHKARCDRLCGYRAVSQGRVVRRWPELVCLVAGLLPEHDRFPRPTDERGE